METALNVASFVFVGTVLFGLVLLGYAVWGWSVRRRYVLHSPATERLPTRALDETHLALERLRARFFHASGARRTRLGHEVQRLEMRVQHLQQRTNEEQHSYYQLCRRREKAWLHWHQAFERMDSLHRRERQHARAQLADDVLRYRDLERQVKDEWHRAIARDELNLQELLTQGVLSQEAEPAPHGAPEGHDESTEPEPEPEGVVAAARARQQAQSRAAHEAPESDAEPDAAEAAGEAEAPAAGAGHGSREALQEERRPAGGGSLVPEMRQADFEIPDLPKAGLRYADAEFSMATLPQAMLAEVNLSGASFAGVRLVGVHHYRGCNFAGANFRGTVLARAGQPHQFVDCDLAGANFAGAFVEFALFLRCNLTLSRWPHARLNRVKFAECDISGASWEGVDLSRTVMTQETLEQGEFSEALLPPQAAAPSPYDVRAHPGATVDPGATGAMPGAAPDPHHAPGRPAPAEPGTPPAPGASWPPEES